MAGQLGAVQATVSKLQVVKVDPEKNLMLIRGAVPGPQNGVVTVRYQGRESEEIIRRREAERLRQAEAAKKPETIQKAPRGARGPGGAPGAAAAAAKKG
jgi:hypothetical protein